MTRRGFTLIEVLVVIAIVAVLLSVLLPTLRGARQASRSVACASQLRQLVILTRIYADQNRGYGPAIGWPYDRAPNWGLVVQTMTGHAGTTTADLFREKSALVCPSAAAFYGPGMTRTYAMNATGHAGPAMGDDTNFDATPGASIRLDLVDRPDATPVFVDAARITDTPTPSRTASTLDFRQAAHVKDRLGRWHGRTPGDAAGSFGVGFADGSASTRERVDDWWLRPLP